MYDRSLDHLMQQVAAQPEEKQLRLSTENEAGKFRAEIDVRLRRNRTPHRTIYHGDIQDYYVLSLSAMIQEKGVDTFGREKWQDIGDGQCQDTIRDIFSGPTWDDLDELFDIWDEWHLNDMKSACIHQVDGAHVKPGSNQWIDEWDEMVREQRARCPEQYSYGSQWLVKPLPPSVLRWYVNLEGGE
jgi:hypothetical protein